MSMGSAAVLDFDSDGDLDLVIPKFKWPPAAASVLAFRNDSNGNFTEDSGAVFSGEEIMMEHARHWAVADFNNDGRDDLFIADHGKEEDPLLGGQSLILIQNEHGQLINETAERIPLERAFTHHVSVGDIDVDGDIDIYLCNIWAPDEIGPTFYINDGNGFFKAESHRLPVVIANLQKKYTSSLFLDVNNDGFLDLVLGGHGGTYETEKFPSDSILLNDGNGYFSFDPEDSLPPRTGGPTAGTVAISAADFDQDGFVDLLMSTHVDYTDPNLQLLLNNGDGSFRDGSALIEQDWYAQYLEDGLHWIQWPMVIDYNLDGWPDIITVGSGLESILFENQGGSKFISKQVLPKKHDSYVIGISSEDFNDDDVIDLMLLYNGSTQVIYLGPID